MVDKKSWKFSPVYNKMFPLRTFAVIFVYTRHYNETEFTDKQKGKRKKKYNETRNSIKIAFFTLKWESSTELKLKSSVKWLQRYFLKICYHNVA